MAEYSSIILLDKPAAMTSFGLVARVRRILGAPKVGHAGTLDPLATGLMILGVGPGTKELTDLVKLDKEYRAEILVGQKRTTGDMEGLIVAQREVAEIFSEEKISATLHSLIGQQNLPVSAYSAIKVDGVPMYKRARAAEKRGEQATPVPQRNMRVDEVELLGQRPVIYDSEQNKFFEKTDDQFLNEVSNLHDNKRYQHCVVVTARFAVGSGTYIRSLAEEFGRRLDYPATLYSLRRTKVGKFDIKDAVTLEHLAIQYGKELF